MIIRLYKLIDSSYAFTFLIEILIYVKIGKVFRFFNWLLWMSVHWCLNTLIVIRIYQYIVLQIRSLFFFTVMGELYFTIAAWTCIMHESWQIMRRLVHSLNVENEKTCIFSQWEDLHILSMQRMRRLVHSINAENEKTCTFSQCREWEDLYILSMRRLAHSLNAENEKTCTFSQCREWEDLYILSM